MRKTSNAYENGRSTYLKGKSRKPTDDKIFIEYVLELKSIDGVSSREAKTNEINEWKRGWDEGKNPVNKKASKKKAKKKVSK